MSLFKKGDFYGIYSPEGLIEYQVESRIFKWKLEYSSGISNIQVETRIFKWKLECQVETRISSEISNIQVETRIFKWKLEYSSGNSNIQVESASIKCIFLK